MGIEYVILGVILGILALIAIVMIIASMVENHNESMVGQIRITEEGVTEIYTKTAHYKDVYSDDDSHYIGSEHDYNSYDWIPVEN